MIKIITLLFLFGNLTYAQSEVQKYRDEMNANEAWGEGEEFVEQLYHLSHLAEAEDSFDVYEQCLSYIRHTTYDLKDFIAFDSALQISQVFVLDTLHSSSVFRSALLNDRAILARSLGNYQEANKLYLQAIDLESKYSNSGVQLISYYLNIVNNLKDLGDSKKSKEYLDHLHSLDFKDNFKHKAKLYNRYSVYYYELDNYNESIRYLKKALTEIEKVTRKSSSSYKKIKIDIFLFLARSYLANNNFKEAQICLDQASKLQEDFEYRLYRYFELQGKFNLALNNLKETSDNYKMARDKALKKFSKRSEFQVIPRMYLNLANYYEKVDSIDLALEAVQTGLLYSTDQKLESLLDNPAKYEVKSVTIAFKLLQKKSSLAKNKYDQSKSQDDYAIARMSYDALVNLLAQMREGYILDGSKFYTAEKAIPVFDDYIDFVYGYIEDSGDTNEFTLIDSLIQNTKSTVLQDKLDYKLMIANLGMSNQLIEQEEDLRKEISLVTKSIKIQQTENDVHNTNELSKKLFNLNQQYTILDNRIKKEYPEYYQIIRGESESVSKLKLKSADDLLIEFYNTNSFFYTVVQTNDGIQVFRDSITQLNDQIARFSHFTSSKPSIKSDYRDSINTLGESLALSLLHIDKIDYQKVNHLHVIPNTMLNSLSFEALQFGDSYLIEHAAISYYYSKSQYFSEKESKNNSNVLALAPSFSELNATSDNCNNCFSGNVLVELENSNDELLNISSNFTGKYYYGQESTVQSFINNVNDYSTIHLATHACLNSADPMLSEIFFSDGSLTNYDLQNFNISPELVVLAACNTAQGEIQKGEGVISLSRGFFEAGVKSLVSSLWSINDYSTSEIVKGMYSHLKDGKSKSESLRQAKLDYLKSADKLRSHPYYWAGLVQIGDNSPILQISNFSLYYLFVVLFIVVLVIWYIKSKKT